MSLSAKDSIALQSLASSSRSVAGDIAFMKEEQKIQTDLLESILAATKSGKGGGITGFFEGLGKAGKGIKAGAAGMKDFAEGVVDLTKALTKFQFTPGKKTFINFFGELADAFGNAGADRVNIKRGMALTRSMGKALLIFGASLALSTVLFIVGAPGAVLATAAIAGLGFVFATVGKAADQITDGSKAVAFMGLAISSLALGLFFFQKTLGDDPGAMLATAAVLTLTIGGLALVFGIAGKFAKEIALGSAAMIVGGLSIIAISAGLLVFKEAEFGWADLGILAATIVGLGVVFALAGIPVVAGLIFLGSVALITAGVALIAISTGLVAFKSVKFTEEDGEVLAVTMKALGTGFSALTLAGIAKMALATPALIGAGLGLISISAGLKKFKSVKFEEDDAEKLKTVITGLAEAFAVAGGAKPAPGSSLFQKVFFGEPNIVEKGIDSVMSSGKALKSITEGLKAWKSLDKIGFGEGAFDANQEGSMMWNIKATIGSIHEVFSAIGRGGGEDDRSMFGKLFRAKRTDTEKGINAVKDVGGVLNGVADGLKKWMDLSSAGIDIPMITGNIKHVLTAVSQAFAQIGGMEEEDSALFGLISWDENVVEKGINAVKGVGEELEGIANGLKIFADLSKVGLSEKDFDPNYKGGLMWNIAQTVTGVAQIFSNIASGDFVSDGWLWDDNLVEEGIAAVAGIGPELESIAKSVKAFSELEDGSADKVSSALASIFKVVSNAPPEGAVTALEETATELERIADLEDPFEKIAKHFKTIAKETGNFAKHFKRMDRDTMTTYNEFSHAMVAFSKVRKSNFLLNSGVAQDFISRSNNRMTAPDPITTTKTRPTPAPSMPDQKGEKKVATKTSPVSAKKAASAPVDTRFEDSLQMLQDEMKGLKSSMGRIEIQLGSTIKVEVVD